MKIQLEPGVYVLAVSGGVDSMVLLDILSKLPKKDYRFIIAHFEHGIRTNSEDDLHLVQKTAGDYGMPFVFNHGRLGTGASEALAREARYKFLRRVVKVSQADAIITAHHQDDVLETAILNMMRGTGSRGLTSLKSTDEIIRPLLSYSKKDILAYAKKHKIDWHEDSTNLDQTYKRNQVRLQLMPKLSAGDRLQLAKLINLAEKKHAEIDSLLPDVTESSLNRQLVIGLPHAVTREMIAQWLKAHDLEDITKDKIERLVVAAKTLQKGKQIELDKNWKVTISKESLALTPRER